MIALLMQILLSLYQRVSEALAMIRRMTDRAIDHLTNALKVGLHVEALDR